MIGVGTWGSNMWGSSDVVRWEGDGMRASVEAKGRQVVDKAEK